MINDDRLKHPTFRAGDRVYHALMEEHGTVTEFDSNGTVHVEYDRLSPARAGEPAKHWRGEYDTRWFEIHPGVLVKSRTR